MPASRNSRPEARDETAQRGRRHRLVAALFGTALCLTGPAAAAEEPAAFGAAQGPAAGSQSTGSIHGRVTTGDGRPVAGATVTLVSLEAQESGTETVTDMNGRFSEVDLAPGQYSVSAGRTDLGDQIFRVLVHPASSVDVRFVLEAGRTAAPWLRALRDDETAAAAFAAGVRANRDAFLGFEADAVANLTEPSLEELAKDTRVIRNRRKIEAVVGNARRMLELEDSHGSFKNYLQSHGSFDETVKSLRKQFKFLGDAGSY